MRLSAIWDRVSHIPARWWVVSGISLGLTFALALNLSPWLRGDEDWRWDYLPAFTWAQVLIVAGCLAGYIALAALAWRWGEVSARRAGWVVTGVVALVIPIQFLALTINTPDPLSVLIFRTTSPFTSGFHDVGIKVEDVGDYLRTFPQLVANYHPHTQRRPPGLILYFAEVKRGLTALPGLTTPLAESLYRYRCDYWPLLYASDADFAAAAGGLLTLVLNAVALWPFFAAAQPLLGRRAALAAVLLSPLIPGYVMWAGIWDQAMVVVTCLLLWLLYRALCHQAHWAWVAMGILLSVSTFFTYAVLPLIGFIAVCVALEFWREPDRWQTNFWQWILNAVGFGAGLVSGWGVYWLWFGVSFFEIYQATTAQHFAMQTHYWSRLFYNPYDFALYLGFGIALLALIATAQMIRAWFQHRSTPAHSFALAGVLMIAIITLLNISRAEVGRVWVLYMPLIVFAAFAAEHGPAQSVGRWLTTAGLLAAQLLVMLSILIGYPPAHLYPPTVSSEAIAVKVNVGETIELAGYNISPAQVHPGDSLKIKLQWRTRQSMSGQFVAFIHLVDAQGKLIAGYDSPPRGGQYPTSCWQAGQVIADEMPVAINLGTPPGVYEIQVGMYDPANDNQRLPLSGPNVSNNAATLTAIEIR